MKTVTKIKARIIIYPILLIVTIVLYHFICIDSIGLKSQEYLAEHNTSFSINYITNIVTVHNVIGESIIPSRVYSFSEKLLSNVLNKAYLSNKYSKYDIYTRVIPIRVEFALEI